MRSSSRVEEISKSHEDSEEIENNYENINDYEDEIEYVITGDLAVGSVGSGYQTVALSFLVVCVFLLMGTLFFGLVEGWSALDALYFSTSTITTCGLGDLVPKHSASKIFMIFYVVAAVLLIGSALGLLAQAALRRHEYLRDLAVQRHYHGPKVADALQSEGCNRSGSNSDESQCGCIAVCKAAWDKINPIGQRSIIALAVLFLVLVSAVIFFTQSQGWTILDSLYYAVLVSSTVGLGDIVVDSSSGKIFSIFLMLCGCATVATSLTSIADMFIRHTHRQLAKKILLARVLPESLLAMDLYNTGNVTQQEFLEFMLVHMGFVLPADIAAINRRFEELDRNHSGTLDLEDVSYSPIPRGLA